MPERKVYEMIDKDAPVLAFDVSKGCSHCQGFVSFGESLGRPIKAAHTKSGMAPAEEISRCKGHTENVGNRHLKM